MILEYVITDNMISSAVSISEKIGRLKEIRESNKHIDFDTQCNVKNIQSALEAKGIIYLDEIIVNLLESGNLSQLFYEKENAKVVKKVVELYSINLMTKSLDFKSYIQVYNKSRISKSVQVNKLNDIIEKQNIPNHFFLYHIAEFCNDCHDRVPGCFIAGWLIACFYKEHGIMLNLPYNDYSKKQEIIMSQGGGFYSFAAIESLILDSPHPQHEFLLSLINQLLVESLDFYYDLVHPVSGRVEMLKGIIKEPFTRKNYMTYHKISTATASLDLKKAVEKRILTIRGDKRNSVYWYRV